MSARRRPPAAVRAMSVVGFTGPLSPYYRESLFWVRSYPESPLRERMLVYRPLRGFLLRS